MISLSEAYVFLPEKRGEMQAVTAAKSPVKMKNFKRANNNDNSVTITKYTTVTAVKQRNMKFAFSEELSRSATGKPVRISSIPNLEQLITIKGKMSGEKGKVSGEKGKVSGEKVQATHFGRLRKQDIIVAVPTGYIKLVLWGDFVNTLDVNNT